MTFQPLLPSTGIVGFQLLSRTEETQRAVFERQPALSREVDYFVRNIGSVTSAEELASDRRLLRVALGAFGLDEDLDKRAFIQRMLAEGVEDSESFANQFVDPRYGRLSEAFGFGSTLGPQVARPGFAQEIAAAYSERQFEIAVGDQDESLRLALNFRREIQTYANASDPSGTAWLSVLGDRPVRAVFEGAFGLPSAFGQLDVDRQAEEMREASQRFFGSDSLAAFQDPAVVEQAINRFLARRAAEAGPTAATPGFAALTLLNFANG
ncbi:MAG: DUF1217 domain-containing protein, partial [Pseudomonadota bacterium]